MMMLSEKKGAILATSLYIDGKLAADDAEITPPDIEFLTTTIQAAGEMEVPMAGVTGPIELGITVPGISVACGLLAQPEDHTIVINAVQQVIGIDGKVKNERVKYTATGKGKKVPSSATKQGEAGSQEYTILCSAYKETIGKDTLVDINKLSGDCTIMGKNYGSSIRNLL